MMCLSWLNKQTNNVNYPSKKKTLCDWWVASKVKPSGASEIPTTDSDDIAFQEDETPTQADIEIGNVGDEPINLVDGAVVEEIDPNELRHEVSPNLLNEEGEEEEEEEVEVEEEEKEKDSQDSDSGYFSSDNEHD